MDVTRTSPGLCVLQKHAEDLQADNDKKEGRTKANRQVEESDRKRRDWRIGLEAAETSTAVWPTIPFRFFTETEATARRLRRRAMKPNLSWTPVETLTRRLERERAELRFESVQLVIPFVC